jgi:isopenicillin N synthase-like dioxygenase
MGPDQDGSTPSGRFSEIPVVDLGRWRGSPDDRAALADEVKTICHEVGFFLVVNHGVDHEFVDSIFEMMQQLFALSPEEKSLIDKRRSRHFRGWERVGAERTNNRTDIREQVDTWSETPARRPDAEPAYLRLLGPNQWLPDDVLPGFRDLTLDWFTRLGALADELMQIMSVGLGLDENHLDRLFGEERMSLSKFIHYPPTPLGDAGVNAHHDAGFLTVLAPGSTPGLEVQNGLGEWIPVPQVADSFVINLGEMLQGMTGNYFVATPHRVITTETRYSAGYFHGPSLETPLTPIGLAPEFAAAVAASPLHAGAGFMARKDETEAGVDDMSSTHRPDVYGEQLWNYFVRSYPDLVAEHYPDMV